MSVSRVHISSGNTYHMTFLQVERLIRFHIGLYLLSSTVLHLLQISQLCNLRQKQNL